MMTRSVGRDDARIATARLWEIDALRGLAIVLMVGFHLAWDLQHLGLAAVDVFSLPWQIFARGIGSLFIFLLGVSLVLSDARALSRRALLGSAVRRAILLLALGMGITAATALFVGAGYVRFGILHLLSVATLLALPALAAPRWVSAAAGALMIAFGIWLNTLSAPFAWLLWLGLPQAGVVMVDYYPVLPWAGVGVLGVAAGRAAYPQGRRSFTLPQIASTPLVRALGLLGRHSLIIYVLHQPVLLGFLRVAQRLSE
jgi:uncharacterized membrane protein